MKITLTPSEDQIAEKHPYYAVTVEFPHDDHITDKRLVEMFHQAAIGWGYSGDQVQKAMNEFIP